jgi:hypothetical protein
MAGAEVLWQPALTSNGAAEHATECDPIDRAGMDTETNDPSHAASDAEEFFSMV